MATYWENSCSFGLRYVSWYKYLIVSLVFSHLGFWSGNLFLIAPFPDLCLLVPFPENSYMSPLLKTRTITSFIPQPLLSWQRTEGPKIDTLCTFWSIIFDNYLCTDFLIFKCRTTRRIKCYFAYNIHNKNFSSSREPVVENDVK